MITRRSVFKNPLCPSCRNYRRVVLQDGSTYSSCCERYPITPISLATECTGYYDVLKDKYYEAFEKETQEITILGEEKKTITGFKFDKGRHES